MSEIAVYFPHDPDGPKARIDVGIPDPERLQGGPLELGLRLDGEEPGADPVLALTDLESGRAVVRSTPLPGPLFFRLKGIWEARAGEGFEVRLVPKGAEPRPLGLARVALDFSGNLARARALETRGDLAAALEAARASKAPGAAAEVARLEARASGAPPPPAPAAASGDSPAEGELSVREVFRIVLRAMVADGKIDAQEARTFKALQAVFPLPREELEALVAEAKEAPRSKGGGEMVPQAVLVDLLRASLRDGRIGPGSAQVLNRASRALGLTREQVMKVLGKKK